MNSFFTLRLQATLPAPVVPADEIRLAVLTALARLNLSGEELTVQIHGFTDSRTQICNAMVVYQHLLYASVFKKTLVSRKV